MAQAVAEIEDERDRWQQSFYEILSDYRFLPGGRILAGAGARKRVTLFNCFVMGPVVDSTECIFDSLKEAAITMQQGGGIGCDFSTLRPAGCPAISSGATASGPVSFMRIWDALCEALLETSTRRGAMMATLRCDHPDIEKFVNAKRYDDVLSHFNLSVLITDSFMQAVADDAEWTLRFPATDEVSGSAEYALTRRSLPARQLWRQIVDAAHASAEPGVLFVDTINRENNLYYCEEISATNPCGEIPLPPHGACNLGSINLTTMIREPFTPQARLDERALARTAGIAVRFLDNVIDLSQFPLECQARQTRASRRIGLGVTGLADMLVMMGIGYDSEEGRNCAAKVMQVIRDNAYIASINIAKEKGAFPLLNTHEYLHAPFIDRLPDSLKTQIAAHGIRNSHLLAIAPTGTISLLANNVSSGIEPIYALEAVREVRGSNLEKCSFAVRDYAYAHWLANGGQKDDLPDYFVTADALSPQAHLDMQSTIQCFVDNAISKTVNLPECATVDDVADTFSNAYKQGIKGCTIYRSGVRQGQVLRRRDESHCCDVEREAD